MRKSKRFKYISKKLIILILIIAILSININTFAVFFTNTKKSNNSIRSTVQAQNEVEDIVRVADPSTVDDYKKLNMQGGRYNGRVWTDKSVYANNGEGQVSLDSKFNIQYDDDFLTVFSAIGSSESIKREIGIDLSIIIDVSGSMGTDVVCNEPHEENDKATRLEHSRIQATINAVNNTIDKLMNTSEKNKVCVVAYGGTAYKLMELGHYTKIDDTTPYITVEDITDYKEDEYKPTGSLAYTLRANAKKDNKETINRSIRNNYLDSVSESKQKNVDACLGYHTNMQAGIYLGFQELYDNAANTDEIRMPTVIIMTDGGSNYALKNSGDITGEEWHDVPIQKSLQDYVTDYKKYRTETNEIDKGGKETILDILMTAAYMKAKVQKKYAEIYAKHDISQYLDSLDFKIHTVTVDTIDMLDQERAQWQVPRIYTALDPKNYFKADLPEVTWDFKQNSIDAYKLFQQWINSPSGISTSFVDSEGSPTINFKINKLILEDEVTNEDIVENIYYNDSFNDVKSSNLDVTFTEIIDGTIFNPIGESKNDVNEVNALSYIDPIGEYMEIKDVKKLLLFGEEYNIIKEGEPVVEGSISKQYYKAVDSNNEDLEIVNPSYETQVKFKLSDIKIWKEINNESERNSLGSNSDETLRITLPSSAIPINLDKLRIDELNNITQYETQEVLPIRVVYTVGISDTIIDKNSNKVIISKLSNDYFEKNKQVIEENGEKNIYIYFYSNYYGLEKYNNENSKTVGDAATTFSPSSANRFYIFQKNLTIYQASNGGDSNGEGVLIDTGGQVNLSEPVTDLTQINSETTYYFAIDYYEPIEGNDIQKGKYVKYAISRKGADFYGESGESYLTYYNTKTNKEVNSKGQDIVVATKKGGKRIGDLMDLAIEKNRNNTNTANLYYSPSIGHTEDDGQYSIITYLGNNGRLAVQMDFGSAKIIKTDETDKPLKGATFGLYAKEDITFMGKLIYGAGKEIESKTTGEDGIVEFNKLYPGTYEVKEKEAPNGYKLLENPILIKITEEELSKEFTVKDEVLYGSAKIIKTDENDKQLKEATFGLYAKEDITLNGKAMYRAGQEIERKTTEEDGIIEFKNLYLGKYEIKEIEAPTGYKLLEEVVSFEVTSENIEHEFKIKNISEKKPTIEKIPEKKPPVNEPSDTVPMSELPQTGEAKNMVILTIAMDIIIIGIVFYRKYRKLKEML